MKKTFIELFILLIISSIIIFYQFNQTPKKLSWDELEFTRLALSLDNKPYTPYSQLATGHSTLYFYIILVSFKFFGVNKFALRLPSAVFGILNVLLFYFIAQTVFEKISYFKKHFFSGFASLFPFFVSFIFATTRWYFNFARFSFEATFLLFLELLAIFFFLSWFKTKQTKSLIASAIFLGFTFLSYYPGRIFFLLPLLFLILYSKKNLLKINLLIFSLFFLVIVFPLFFYLSTHKDLRVEEQLFLIDRKLSVIDKISYIGQNVVKLAQMFNLEGDLNGRHNYPGKPILNPLVGAFFIVGFLVTILNLKNFYNQFFLTFFFISLFPALFTYPVENPNNLRTYTAIVPATYFLGNGVIYLLQSENKSKKLFLLTAYALLLLFILSSLYEVRTYFRYQKWVFKKAFELNGSIQKILNLRLWEKVNSL